MFSWRAEVRPGVWAAFTNVAAGNLALHVDDDPAAVHGRRERLAAEAGLGGGSFRFMNQVHGKDVAVLDAGGNADGTVGTRPAPTADALVSTGAPLAVMVADCVPILLVGERAGGATPVLAAVHAGRQGTASGVVPAAVDRMRSVGAERIGAWIGPSICGNCYEVPDALRAEVAAVVPATWCTTSHGTAGLDLPAGIRSQLADVGVSVEYSGGCTLEDPQLFSYRRANRTGRFAGLVWTATPGGPA